MMIARRSTRSKRPLRSDFSHDASLVVHRLRAEQGLGQRGQAGADQEEHAERGQRSEAQLSSTKHGRFSSEDARKGGPSTHGRQP